MTRIFILNLLKVQCPLGTTGLLNTVGSYKMAYQRTWQKQDDSPVHCALRLGPPE